ncbi:MAG: hypothetical protein ACP5XB_32220 [Isosphaeraceae bacterium]
MLKAACRADRRDLATSLAESIKDTPQFERSTEIASQPVLLTAEHSLPVSVLPKPWADWARGWSHVNPLSLLETVALERSREPVEVRGAMKVEDATDPNRELRLARVDEITARPSRNQKTVQGHGLNTDKMRGRHHGSARWITRGCNPRACHGSAGEIVSGVQDSRG